MCLQYHFMVFKNIRFQKYHWTKKITVFSIYIFFSKNINKINFIWSSTNGGIGRIDAKTGAHWRFYMRKWRMRSSRATTQRQHHCVRVRISCVNKDSLCTVERAFFAFYFYGVDLLFFSFLMWVVSLDILHFYCFAFKSFTVGILVQWRA